MVPILLEGSKNMAEAKTYRLLGRTGLRVSPLALGTMTFGQDNWGADEDTARTIFVRYLESGGNFVDTANIYSQGRSEELTGKFIKEAGARDRVVLATKFSQTTEEGNPNSWGNGRKNTMSALDGSLRRLDTDYVDLYWLHIWDVVTPVEEVMSTFDALVRSGKVRAVGLSNVPAWYAAKAQMLAAARGWEPIAALQMEYSLVERQLEHEHVPAAVDLGMSIVPWSPLAHGFLSGKYRREGSDFTGSGRLDGEQFRMIRQTFGQRSDQDWATIGVLQEIASETGRTVAQIALAWVAGQPGVTSTLIGARNLDQLEDNLAVADFALSPEQRARLSEVSAPPQVAPYIMFEPDIQETFVTRGMRIVRPGQAA